MAHRINSFVWHEVHINNVEKSREYYADVLGWKAQEMDMGEGEVYEMLADSEGKPQMGLVKSSADGAPPHFAQYLAVQDVDATAKKVEAAGGKILVPPTDIPVGRFSVIADPQGGALALFKGKEADGDGSSEFHWNELWSPNSKEVLPFYEHVFDVTVESMEMAGMKEPYSILKSGEELVGGVMTSPMEGIPAMWLPYVKVKDVDATIERAKARGGELLSPIQDVQTVGRFGIVKEPDGAVLGFITPKDS